MRENLHVFFSLCIALAADLTGMQSGRVLSCWVKLERWKHKMKSRKWLYIILHLRMVQFMLSAWWLLLTSSVHVATLAMQPRLVEPWKCRVQQSRQFSSDPQRHRQRGIPVLSCDVWYLPMVLTGWLMVMSYVVLFVLKRNITYEMDAGKEAILWTKV